MGFQDGCPWMFSWFFLEGFAYEKGERSDGCKEEESRQEEGQRRRLTKKKSSGGGFPKKGLGLPSPHFLKNCCRAGVLFSVSAVFLRRCRLAKKKAFGHRSKKKKAAKKKTETDVLLL